ncbi:MAG: hypothetical protein RL375_3176 [Pseudomonadota bacterium]
MPYTYVISEGLVVRDDGVVVAPTSDMTNPDYLAWLAWCEAGNPVQQIQQRRPAVPSSVTRRQMLTALHRLGWLDSIRAAIAASPDVELQIAFNEAQDFEREHPAINQLATAFGNTQDQIDDLFILASSL